MPLIVPPPMIGFDHCADGEHVCIGIGDAVSLGKWVESVHEVELAIESCSLVTRP